MAGPFFGNRGQHPLPGTAARAAVCIGRHGWCGGCAGHVAMLEVSVHLVRDEGVAGSNPATPTNFPQVCSVMGPDMGNETPYRAMLGRVPYPQRHPKWQSIRNP